MARPRNTTAPAPNYQVRALQRGLAILTSFSPNEPSLSLADVSGRLQLPKPTALRLLECLRVEGFASFDAASARYSLGPRAFEVASAYLATSPLERLAMPVLRELADRTDQTANLGILDNFSVMHLAVAEPARPLRYHTRAGERDALHCTGLGKVLLSTWSEERLAALVASVGLPRRTPTTLTNLGTLEQELEQVRAHGYAEDRQEGIPGLRCLAAPVHDTRGEVVGAISISGPAADFDDDHRTLLLEALLGHARGLSAKLGWPPTAHRDGGNR
jgi:DNA-binding IclR family transcriptional regulator